MVSVDDFGNEPQRSSSPQGDRVFYGLLVALVVLVVVVLWHLGVI